MHNKEHSFESCRELYENDSYSDLAVWIQDEGELYFKTWSAAHQQTCLEQYSTDQEVASVVLTWFLSIKSEEVERFWRQAFGRSSNLNDLRKHIKNKGVTLITKNNRTGGMHKHPGIWLQRVCREVMDSSEDEFRKETVGKDKYKNDIYAHGLKHWPGAQSQGVLMGHARAHQLKERAPFPYNYCGSKRTLPFQKEDIREGCKLALTEIKLYTPTRLLRDAMIEAGWFIILQPSFHAYDPGVRGKLIETNRERPGKEELTFEDPEALELISFLQKMEIGAQIVLLERVLASALGYPIVTFQELSKKYGRSLQTYKNREKRLQKDFKTFLESYTEPDRIEILRFLCDCFEKGKLGHLIIDE